MSLAELHFVLNETMGWFCSHPHSFSDGKRTFSDPDLDLKGERGYVDERPMELQSIVKPGGSLDYVYDFGDAWHHEIRVEQSLPADERLSYPLCIGGERACPPEDCGGPAGYSRVVEALQNTNDEAHDELLTSLGGYFDPASFDVNRTNFALRMMYEHAECSCGHCGDEDHECDCDHCGTDCDCEHGHGEHAGCGCARHSN
jgi:hypothetical protein